MLLLKHKEQEHFYKALGTRIRELRGTNMSQEELAEAVGLRRTSIVNIEGGRQKVLVHNLFNIASALGVKASALLLPLENKADDMPGIDFNGEVGNDVNEWIQRTLRKAKQRPTP